MKTLILFAAKSELTDDHYPVPAIGECLVYVRAVEVEMDISDALDIAGKYQLPGETVLNTVPMMDDAKPKTSPHAESAAGVE